MIINSMRLLSTTPLGGDSIAADILLLILANGVDALTNVTVIDKLKTSWHLTHLRLLLLLLLFLSE